jgi:hypothetical protein
VKSGLENRDYGLRGSAALTMRHLSPQKLALISPTSGGRSVGIVRSRTKATELASHKYSDEFLCFVTTFFLCLLMPQSNLIARCLHALCMGR